VSVPVAEIVSVAVAEIVSVAVAEIVSVPVAEIVSVAVAEIESVVVAEIVSGGELVNVNVPPLKIIVSVTKPSDTGLVKCRECNVNLQNDDLVCKFQNPVNYAAKLCSLS
jgi:hypothetical protein